MQILADVQDWIVAVSSAYHGWLGGSAVAGVLGLGAGLGCWHPRPKPYYGLIGFGLLVSVFQSWRKEHVANRNGPDILLEWCSIGYGGHDRIRLKNCGHATAVNVIVGQFSRDNLFWHNPIEVQSIAPDKFVDQEAYFAIHKSAGDQEVGYMHSVLRSDRIRGAATPISLSVRFSDMNQTAFTRTFFLRCGTVEGTEVTVEPGPLKMKRRH